MLTFTGLHPFSSPRSLRARTSSANPLYAPESGDSVYSEYRIGSINQLQGSSNTLHSGATTQFTCFAGTTVQKLTQNAPTETRTYEGERQIRRTSSAGERLTGRCPSYVRSRINADHPDGNDGEACQNPFSLAKAWHKERATALIADIIQNQAEKERELRSDLCCLTIHEILVLLYFSMAQKERATVLIYDIIKKQADKEHDLRAEDFSFFFVIISHFFVIISHFFFLIDDIIKKQVEKSSRAEAGGFQIMIHVISVY
jgi:hypothetical protein